MKKWITVFGCVAICGALFANCFDGANKTPDTSVKMAVEPGPGPMSIQYIAYDTSGQKTLEA